MTDLLRDLLAQRLKQAREDASLTQEDVGRELGVSWRTVSRWEQGTATPKGTTLDRLTELYGVTMAQLTTPGKGRSISLPKQIDRLMSVVMQIQTKVEQHERKLNTLLKNEKTPG